MLLSDEFLSAFLLAREILDKESLSYKVTKDFLQTHIYWLESVSKMSHKTQNETRWYFRNVVLQYEMLFSSIDRKDWRV